MLSFGLALMALKKSKRLNKMSQKFAITGGAGFIGSNLAEALASENEVVVIDDLSTGKLQNLDGINVKLIRGSITDLTLLRSAFEDVTRVFHLYAIWHIASGQRSVEDHVRTNYGTKKPFRRKILSLQNLLLMDLYAIQSHNKRGRRWLARCGMSFSARLHLTGKNC